MVAPIYIIAIALAVAFLMPLFERFGKAFISTLFLTTLAVFLFISGQWFYAFYFNGMQTVQVFTAGVLPPLSINLQMGYTEAMLLSAINLLALMGGVYLLKHLRETGTKAHILFLLFVLGMNGLVMTRDIFNVFVFLEITSISSYILIGMDLKLRSLTAGFKYMIAGSLASMFLLIGIIFLYQISGTLNIDGLIKSPALSQASPLIGLAAMMLMISFFVEMKQFPANGWAVDVYQSAHPGIAAMISAGSSGAIFFTLYKILPIAGETWYLGAAVAGTITFVVSNLIGLKQKNATRLLGYSSVGQMGLLLATLGFAFLFDVHFTVYGFILAALFFNHFFAKAGLYWLAGIVKKESIKEWTDLKSNPKLIFLFGVFAVALLGFPPFAGFWGKWSLVMNLAEHHQFAWIGFLLLGSLLEAVYLLRWFGLIVKGEKLEETEIPVYAREQIPLWSFAVVTILGGIWASQFMLNNVIIMYLPLMAALCMFALYKLPLKLKGFLTLAIIAAYATFILPQVSGIAFYFDLVFLVGGGLILFSSLNRTNRSFGFYSLMLLMIGSLSNLVLAKDLLQFFFAWELMTLSSYLLILRGKQAEKPALQYVLFSLGGAFVLLLGFAFAHAVTPDNMLLNVLGQAGPYAAAVFALVAVGFLVKIAAIGVHIWAPGAYAEAEDDTTTIISTVLSKAGIFGFVMLFMQMGEQFVGLVSLNTLLGWIGAFTAFFATLYAVFQEDVKKLVAWSSVGQVGYILLGLAAMSHLGWAAALWHTVNHFLFKGLIFLAVAGVIYRVGTRDMYKMGGLIKRMPLSFISVMIGIIALSGVPPLTGFGGKWLLYEALIEKGWYLQTGLAFFASTIAFLYCYRLIHTIFLGQPKPDQLKVKEAPLWLIVPQYVLIALIMVFSTKPEWLLQYISQIIEPVFPATLSWQGSVVHSSLGYWDGSMVMILVGSLFVIVMLFLIFVGPKPQKVKSFNIVFAAEKPERPETTHYAYHFFAPYRRAMAPLLKPIIKDFWAEVGEGFTTVSGVIRQIYSGNTQTYALFILIFGVILYAFSVGVN